jgi:glutaminyl-peptide cyclotransferase
MKKHNNKSTYLIIFILAVVLLGGGLLVFLHFYRSQARAFDGAQAMHDVQSQMAFGDRIPGTQGHEKIVAWIQAELTKAGWAPEIQTSMRMGHPIQNVIGKRKANGSSKQPWIIIGAHYDTRMYADQDPDPQKRNQYVPGANDGASGVAVLLELARSLPKDMPVQVWLVFFDAEDNGEIPGWDWLLGSQAFVSSLTGKPDKAVVIDMIGDKDLNIYLEGNSNPGISAAIWAEAAKLGYKQFIPAPKYRMIDDHTPFLLAGIPAVDIIDFDYPYWHTTADTIDKVSAESMKAVGDTLSAWLETQGKP